MTASPRPATPSASPLWPVLAVACLVRVVLLLATDHVDVDVLRYWKVGTHLLDVSWNPYQAPRLYPYPPLWMWVEAGSAWLARATGLSFALLVRLPVLAAEIGLVALVARMAGRPAAWVYALHPVSLLVSACHGQFDAIAMLFVLLAVAAQRAGRLDRAALSLAVAIGLKSFPVLLLPVFLLATPARDRVRWALLATLPVALSLVPFAWHDAGAVRRELLGYGGVADFGWIAAVRAFRFLTTGALARAEAAHWTGFVLAAKVLFGAAYTVLLVRWWRAPRAPDLAAMCLAVLLAFLTWYGALSAQYLLWVVPLGVLMPSRPFVFYSVATTVALVAFYLFLAPGVLGLAVPRSIAGAAWAAGVGAHWLATAGWWTVWAIREAA
jgi:Glycosyltransferase family 87